ncbi:MAG: ParB-like nuclease domain-containing protein [Anaerolineales bacterium]|nr:ParB-like nuclease domain-containing protein [Anaerolineales bacterium]
MSNVIDSQVRSDFGRARFKSFINQVFALLSGQRNNLLSYDDIKEKLKIGGPIYRGVKTVRVDQIAGSLNRYHEFDRAFLPKEDQLASRWQKVDRAFYEDIHLPPVVVYKVGQVYFVVDGHHRVSVAREQGQEFIEAEVRECATRVNITPDIRPEDLEILGAKVDFLERTGLDRLRPDANIKLNIPDGFTRMLEHIAVHQYFMGLDFKRDITEQEAVEHWYDNVYLPIVKLILESGLLEEFPDKTEGDLYLWTLDHQHYLYEEEGQPLQPPETAAKQFIKENE